MNYICNSICSFCSLFFICILVITLSSAGSSWQPHSLQRNEMIFQEIILHRLFLSIYHVLEENIEFHTSHWRRYSTYALCRNATKIAMSLKSWIDVDAALHVTIVIQVVYSYTYWLFLLFFKFSLLRSPN